MISVLPVLTESDIERFWSKVDRRGDDECWPWRAGVFKQTGYGAFWFDGQNVGAHRFSAILAFGGCEDQALHSCDNRICVNPQHLRWGTPADNMHDRSARGRAPVGVDHPNRKLSNEQVDDARARHAAGEGTSSIARTMGVTPQCISHVVVRKNWAHR